MPSDSINSLLAGTTGGVAVTLVGHGFDTVKVRMQTASSSSSSSIGVCSTVSTIYKEGGIGAFYTGVGSPLAGQVFFRSILFFSHNEAKNFVSSPNYLNMQSGSFSAGFVAGGLAGVMASVAESPVDFFKTQKQVRSSPENVFVLGKKLIDQFGVRVAFQGGTGTLIRNIPANSFYFGVFEEMKRRNPLGVSSNFGQLLVAGAVGGTFYWLACFPLDVIKSSMMSVHPSDKTNLLSWRATAAKLWREGGVRRLSRGLTPCLMRAIPANAVMLSTVDLVKDFLKKY